MRVIRVGGKYSIASGEVETYDLLPVQTYVTMYNDRDGFYLTEHPNIEVQEKVYGVHERYVMLDYSDFEDDDEKTEKSDVLYLIFVKCMEERLHYVV